MAVESIRTHTELYIHTGINLSIVGNGDPERRNVIVAYEKWSLPKDLGWTTVSLQDHRLSTRQAHVVGAISLAYTSVSMPISNSGTSVFHDHTCSLGKMQTQPLRIDARKTTEHNEPSAARNRNKFGGNRT